MVNSWLRVTAIAATVAILGCSSTELKSDAITGPLQSDVDVARSAWLTNRPQSYSFEVAMASSWLLRTGYYHVQVSNGRVVAAANPAGLPVTDFRLIPTVDAIWEQLLSARTSGQLNSATFNERGVPVESDMGAWPLDGGVHYSVRSFRQEE